MNSTSTTVIRARDFSDSTTDADRDTWTLGKLRHVIAALDGAPVAITVDRLTGHTEVGVRLVGIACGRFVDHGPVVERTLSDGTTQRTIFSRHSIGDTITPLDRSSAKWTATDSVRNEASAAIRLARAEHEAAHAYGRWTATPGLDYVDVTYTPQNGPGAGERGWWRYSLAALAAVTA